MIGKIFGTLVTLAFICGSLTGNMEAVGNAAVSGAGQAVELTVGLLGILVLWSGILGILEHAGAIKRLSSLLSPLIRRLFPSVRQNPAACNAIAANMSANFLGLGNAATPSGITAMKALSQDDTATADAILFAVMNTVPFQFLPTTLFALRSMAGSERPYIILIPVWLCSLITLLFCVLFLKGLARLRRRKRKA